MDVTIARRCDAGREDNLTCLSGAVAPRERCDPCRERAAEIAKTPPCTTCGKGR